MTPPRKTFTTWLDESRLALPAGVRLSYRGNILHCARFESRDENLKVCRMALIAILGYNPWQLNPDGVSLFDEARGEIEYFRPYRPPTG